MRALTHQWPLRFWIITLAAVAGMLVTASLGRWQLSRAAQKETLQAGVDAQARLPALDGASLAPGLAEAMLHRQVALRGEWVAERTVYLDNRQMAGRPGFFVLTPLRLEGGSMSVLVQRGWVARNFQDRTALPQVETPSGRVTVHGRVASGPSKLYEFQTAGDTPGSSRIRQNLELSAFRVETGLPLADWSVIQTEAASDGLLRDWPVVTSGVEKHYGYAFQWFGLCGLIALLYVWFQIVRRLLRARSAPAA